MGAIAIGIIGVVVLVCLPPQIFTLTQDEGKFLDPFVPVRFVDRLRRNVADTVPPATSVVAEPAGALEKKTLERQGARKGVSGTELLSTFNLLLRQQKNGKPMPKGKKGATTTSTPLPPVESEPEPGYTIPGKKRVKAKPTTTAPIANSESESEANSRVNVGYSSPPWASDGPNGPTEGGQNNDICSSPCQQEPSVGCAEANIYDREVIPVTGPTAACCKSYKCYNPDGSYFTFHGMHGIVRGGNRNTDPYQQNGSFGNSHGGVNYNGGGGPSGFNNGPAGSGYGDQGNYNNRPGGSGYGDQRNSNNGPGGSGYNGQNNYNNGPGSGYDSQGNYNNGPGGSSNYGSGDYNNGQRGPSQNGPGKYINRPEGPSQNGPGKYINGPEGPSQNGPGKYINGPGGPSNNGPAGGMRNNNSPGNYNNGQGSYDNAHQVSRKPNPQGQRGSTPVNRNNGPTFGNSGPADYNGGVSFGGSGFDSFGTAATDYIIDTDHNPTDGRKYGSVAAERVVIVAASGKANVEASAHDQTKNDDEEPNDEIYDMEYEIEKTQKQNQRMMDQFKQAADGGKIGRTMGRRGRVSAKSRARAMKV